MKLPFFSIFIPAKGRPEYLGDAIESALLQNFSNMELVVSNNGADSSLREVVSRYLEDARVRYVEQPDVLDMPTHWEKVTQELVGEYVFVLTDRSVMRAGTLHYLYEQITQMKEQPDVISWPWDIYFDHNKTLLRYPANEKKLEMLDSNLQLKKIAHGSSEYPYCLPRGLNSCVRNSFIGSIRTKFNQAFRPINPDFTFGYLCLLNAKSFAYIDSPLFVSQGLKVSNGGNSYGGDASLYFNSLKLEDPFKHVPAKLPLVQNGIHEDFLAMTSLCGRDDLIALWSRSNYYIECFAEINTKRESGILSASLVSKMEKDLTNALMNETQEIWKAVNQTRTLAKRIRTQAVGLLKRLLGPKLRKAKAFLFPNRGEGIVCETALEAAGFDASIPKRDSYIQPLSC